MSSERREPPGAKAPGIVGRPGGHARRQLASRTRHPVTEEFNYVDLVWHELEFREGTSFTYAIYDTNGGYLGCCYLYPMGTRSQLTEKLLCHDADVSWWVTPDAYKRGYYQQLYDGLQQWLVSLRRALLLQCRNPTRLGPQCRIRI